MIEDFVGCSLDSWFNTHTYIGIGIWLTCVSFVHFVAIFHYVQGTCKTFD